MRRKQNKRIKELEENNAKQQNFIRELIEQMQELTKQNTAFVERLALIEKTLELTPANEINNMVNALSGGAGELISEYIYGKRKEG